MIEYKRFCLILVKLILRNQWQCRICIEDGNKIIWDCRAIMYSLMQIRLFSFPLTKTPVWPLNLAIHLIGLIIRQRNFNHVFSINAN
jgi:hypothetical protein